MIVLHAIWSCRSTLGLWGEDGSPPVGVRRRRGRGPRPSAGEARPRAHPFACDLPALREALGRIGGRPLLNALGETALTLLLPSAADTPQASPRLFRDDDGLTREATGLASWTVPAGELAPGDALDLLLALPDDTPAGVVLGDTFRFFSEVAKLALERVARGRVVPTLGSHDGEFVARWRPVTDEDGDAERLRLLARSMPPLCRAEVAGAPAGPRRRAGKNGRDATTGRTPAAVLEDALGAMTDACVRQALRSRRAAPMRGGARAGKGRRTVVSPAAEAWLAALTGPDPAIAGDAAGLARLRTAVEAWVRAGLAVHRGSFRTCLRLSPPEDGSATWRLDFLLQATDDRSLFVPAGEVWKTRGETLTVLARTLENPQERLLGDLGRATRLWPGLEPALRTARPVGLDLDPDGAYRFLREAAPLLEPSGFGVLVPPWWSAPAARLGVKLRATPKSNGAAAASGLLGIEGVCAYEWQVALGDETLSLAEFRKLAGLKVPLVQVRGQWVELKREEIDAALAFFQRRAAAGEMTVAEALRVGLGIDASPAGLPAVGVEARGWLGELLKARDDERLEAVETPAGFAGTLRPYQARGLAWLAFLSRLGLGACLADDMGLGKTIEFLALLMAERERGEADRPTLLVCPMSVVGNWQREAERFAPSLRVHVHHGAERLDGPAFAKAVRGSDLVITTYALAARDQALLAGVEWGRVALDEAQNVKNSGAKQTRAVRSFNAPRRVALTGTPVENRLAELWSIMEFLNPGLLGPAGEFRTRFATPIERYRDEVTAACLKRLTGPFILRRLKTDRRIIRDLPDKLEMKVYCNLTREQASLYQAVVDEMLRRIDETEGIERKGLVLATMMRLKQVCNHPAHLLQDRSSLEGRSGKLARLEEILEEVLAVGDRALVFTQFAEMGGLLKGYLETRLGREVLFLHGGTARTARDEMVTRFQASGGPPVFLLSLKAGGTGLTLTAASQVIHFDRWWNPAVEDQATDRAFRIGQTKNVQVRKLICVGTLEERIDTMIDAKKELADRVIGAGESWLTELSTAQLRDLVALSADAVAEG